MRHCDTFPRFSTHPTFNWTKLPERDRLRCRGSDSPLEAAVDRFLNQQNIERYRKLRGARNAAERQQVMKLLAEEQAKF